MEEFLWPIELDHHFLTQVQQSVSHMESLFGIEMAVRGNKIMFSGNAMAKKKFRRYLEHLESFAEENGSIRDEDLRLSLQLAEHDRMAQFHEHARKKHMIQFNGREVHPKTINQREYVQAMEKNELAFGIGPAGTGKTFLATAKALDFLLSRRVERIVLTRPVVEAGEKLGFLPGDLYEKINPYLRPLYDALYFFIGMEKTGELIEKGIIEIAPLAYMRGRTITNAYIILDEGQNTSHSQMKMFLTRFGHNSRVVVTADITQIDLDQPKKSGIFQALRILKGIDGIAIVYLTEKDIVRHPLVRKIVEAYEKMEKK